MAFQQDRQMYDVDLTCGKCGAHISQLPFQPTDPDRKVYCADCNREFRNSRRDNNSRYGSRGPAQRQMYDVDVDCAGCGTKITKLPFMPRDGGRPIYCIDCLKKQRA
jgi:CxxC-x17-CxxC domain-containing protein